MAYYSADEMKKILKEYPQYRENLYSRGFLLTDVQQKNLNEYPFYGNWNCAEIKNSEVNYYIYTHKDVTSYSYSDGKYTLFLIGHAYDPFNMRVNENEILQDLAEAIRKGQSEFWDAESNLTGVFCVGYIDDKKIVYSTDCAGMQLVYHGTINNKLYITSHSKLVAD